MSTEIDKKERSPLHLPFPVSDAEAGISIELHLKRPLDKVFGYLENEVEELRRTNPLLYNFLRYSAVLEDKSNFSNTFSRESHHTWGAITYLSPVRRAAEIREGLPILTPIMLMDYFTDRNGPERVPPVDSVARLVGIMRRDPDLVKNSYDVSDVTSKIIIFEGIINPQGGGLEEVMTARSADILPWEKAFGNKWVSFSAYLTNPTDHARYKRGIIEAAELTRYLYRKTPAAAAV